MRQKDILDSLMSWYKSHCNGIWEHEYGIKLDTLDNPGWSLDVDLKETELEDKEFPKIWIDNSDDDWLYCEVVDDKFIARGSSDKLEAILKMFLEFAT